VKRVLVAFCLALLVELAPARPSEPGGVLPYRFLLVISDQWKDPASYVLEGNGEFPVIASLLKSWGLPFEIMRLDQQRLDRYHLLERDGSPRYGTIIWLAGPEGSKAGKAGLLPQLVREYGVNLVVLGDSVAAPDVAALAGLEYVSEYRLPDGLDLRPNHFLTRGLAERAGEFLRPGEHPAGYKVIPRGADVLATRGQLPFLATHQAQGAGRVVWLGAHSGSVQIRRQLVRDLFKRCLVWAQGYALYAEYPKSIVLEMHDMGASDKTFLPYWHYRNLTEEVLRTDVVASLKHHQAKLALLVNTGFISRSEQRVLNPWEQKRVVDELDARLIHDYASLKRGLDAGVKDGVFEIQCHGWTHMLPDLDSPPGPLWTAPLDGTATLGWDNEFGDRIRGKEIPAATQRVHLQRALEGIQQDFGVRPLFLRPGGGEFSRSYENHTGRIAAQMDFGLTRLGSPYYLGHDLVIALTTLSQTTWSYETKISAADIPWTTDGPYFLAFHDRDVSLDPGCVERLLSALGTGVRYFSPDEYTAYLHATVERDTSSASAFPFVVTYEPHYCRYFAAHDSSWVLHLSDEVRAVSGGAEPERRVIRLGPGLGRRSLPAACAGCTKRRSSP
jgi:hypothetical protein